MMPPLKIYQERNVQDTIRHVIAVAAGKGGVGKSTITVNIARALASRGYHVGILDADIYGPSIRMMVSEGSLPYQESGIMYPAEAEGMKILSLAYFKREQEAAAFRAPIVSSMITQFLHDVMWGALDFLLIDFPPGTGDVQLTICQKVKITGAIMVTTPQEVSLIDVRKALDLFKKMHVPILGIVENMSFYIDSHSHEPLFLFGRGGGERLSVEAAVPLLAQVPLEPALCSCSDAGQSIFVHANDSKAAQAISAAAERIDVLVHDMRQCDIKECTQLNPFTLKIVWNDGREKRFRFADIQKACPCIRCQQESEVSGDVSAASMAPVGRYAVRFTFSSGCSLGLYTYEMLRQL